MFKKVWRFIVLSSADPRKLSLTVKMSLLALVPYTMQALEIVCKWGYTCTTLDPSFFELVIETVANAIFYATSLIAAVGVLYGLLRKATLTLSGENEALRD